MTDTPDGSRPGIDVEGVIAAGDAEHRVFGFAVPQVPAAGDEVEHPEGVTWRVVAVRWHVPGRAETPDDVRAVLVVDPL